MHSIICVNRFGSSVLCGIIVVLSMLLDRMLERMRIPKIYVIHAIQSVAIHITNGYTS